MESVSFDEISIIPYPVTLDRFQFLLRDAANKLK